MSNRDFIIDIDTAKGFEGIENAISLFPVAVEIRVNDNGKKYIHQTKVSSVSGFFLDDERESIQSYGISSLISEVETDKLLIQFSDFFKNCNTPHKITEIYHEVDWDKEIINHEWKNT